LDNVVLPYPVQLCILSYAILFFVYLNKCIKTENLRPCGLFCCKQSANGSPVMPGLIFTIRNDVFSFFHKCSSSFKFLLSDLINFTMSLPPGSVRRPPPARVSKPSLPPGWSCHVSKSVPGKCYYFNRFTGAKTWELGELLPGHSDNPATAVSVAGSAQLPIVVRDQHGHHRPPPAHHPGHGHVLPGHHQQPGQINSYRSARCRASS
jgi:hypothetical protein